MKRRPKKHSGVYEYLEVIGLLQQGSAAEIDQAKKQYWKEVRRQWKKAKRKQCKSFTIFYTNSELKMLTQSANKVHRSATNFIKQASLQYGTNQSIVDKKINGEIREAIKLHYFFLQSLEEEKILPQHIVATLLQQALTIETKTMSYLQQV